jgi:hypothetical protein
VTTDAELVQIHPGANPSASLRTPSGRVVRLHSGRDPVAEADRFVESALGNIPGGAPPVVMVIGPGLGYVLEAIERRAPETKIIALEPFPALARAMRERRDWSRSIDEKRLTLLVGPAYTGAGDAGRLLDEKAAAAASIIEHPVMAREFPEEVARARAAAHHIVRGAKLNAEARRQFAGRYLLNTLTNLPALLGEADVSALQDAFTGVPSIVVAAGPSLDRGLPQLRELQDRALIIAVDTTLRPLRAAAIRPHLVVAVDPSELNARHLLELDDTDGSWLVTEGSIDPRVVPQFAGRVFSFKVSDHEPWRWLKTQGVERGTLRAWGSVLTTAFDLALLVGADPIVFVGADLSFPGGVHYCRGTMNEAPETYDASNEQRAEGFAEAARVHQRKTLEAVDLHGAPIVSTPQFVQFRDWLLSRAAEAAPRRVFNATGGGILYGSPVEQTDLAQQARDWPLRGASLAERLADTWNGGQRQALAAQHRLEETLTASGVAAVPMAAWLEFGGANVSAAQLAAIVDATWLSPPAIVAHPRAIARLPGRAAGFTAVASGGPPPSVQWQVSGDQGATWSDVAGANAPVYVFRMTPDDAVKEFRAVFTNRHGSATSDPATLTLASSRVRGDLDGDGHADLVWRQVHTGFNVVWMMDGATLRGAEWLDAEPDTAWEIAGIADIDGDGHSDLLWRNRNSGDVVVWLMNGLTRAGSVPLLAEPDTSWEIAGVADFGGRGGADILWRNAANGRLRVWLMDGTTRIAVEPLDAESDLAWRIAGSGDFDGDDRADIVWRNSATGENRVWLMDGLRKRDVAALDRQPDLSWSIVAARDLDGDGQPDLIWRNAGTGENRVWIMHGLARVRDLPLPAATADWLPGR